MAPGRREAKWNDLDRQWKRAEPRHELGRIGDDDHALRGGGDDLLAQQRPAAALDQTELGIDFVGPVDRQVELRNVVKCSERNAERLRLRGRRLGGRDTADIEARFDLFAHEIDELARGRAAAEPELHARSDQLKRPFGRLALSLVPVWRRGHALNCFRSLDAAARSRAHKPRDVREKPLYRLARTKANLITVDGSPLSSRPPRARPRTSASRWWGR